MECMGECSWRTVTTITHMGQIIEYNRYNRYNRYTHDSDHRLPLHDLYISGQHVFSILYDLAHLPGWDPNNLHGVLL